MAAHLWARHPPPMEYIELLFCRDIYHCTPSELRKERLADILLHLSLIESETYRKKYLMRNG
jgi:hypothetical protein